MLAGRGPRSVATGRRVQPRERGPREREPPRGSGSRGRGRPQGKSMAMSTSAFTS